MTADLIARLEAATEGSRELDREVALAIGWKEAGWQGETLWWNAPSGAVADRFLSYTTSLDAALTLVPESARWRVGDTDILLTKPTRMWATVHAPQSRGIVAGSPGATPALALCIAALKARSAPR